MDAIEIRAPREEEFPTVLRIANVAFGEESTPEDVEAYRKSWPCDRALCAYEAGKMVASSAVLTMELTLPGHVAIPAGVSPGSQLSLPIDAAVFCVGSWLNSSG